MWDALCGLQHTLRRTLHCTVSLWHPRHNPQVGLYTDTQIGLYTTHKYTLQVFHEYAQMHSASSDLYVLTNRTLPKFFLNCTLSQFTKQFLSAVPSICSHESPVMFFPKRYTSHSSIHYHPGDKQLYAWDDGYQTIYKVETSRNDRVPAEWWWCLLSSTL